MDTKAAFEKHLRDQGTKPVGWLKAEYWEIWQASRAAIEIELPEHCNGISSEAAAYDDALDECIEAITSHGIRIKGETE